MTTNRTLAFGTAALIGVLSFAVSTPSSASPPTRFDVCPAILSHPICGLVRTTEPDPGGSRGTKPAVVPQVADEVPTDVDIGCGGISRTAYTVCLA